jgi:hypothetical protein
VCTACVPKTAIGAGVFKNYQVVSSAQTKTGTSFLFGGLEVSCPAGKKVIGGGGRVEGTGGSVTTGYEVLQDGPTGDTGWSALFNITNPGSPTFIMTVYAICATVS